MRDGIAPENFRQQQRRIIIRRAEPDDLLRAGSVDLVSGLPRSTPGCGGHIRAGCRPRVSGVCRVASASNSGFPTASSNRLICMLMAGCVRRSLSPLVVKLSVSTIVTKRSEQIGIQRCAHDPSYSRSSRLATGSDHRRSIAGRQGGSRFWVYAQVDARTDQFGHGLLPQGSGHAKAARKFSIAGR